MTKKRGSTRREMLIGTVGTAASLSTLSGCFPDAGGTWPQPSESPIYGPDPACPTDPLPAASLAPALVVDVYREESVILNTQPGGVSTLDIQYDVVAGMLDQALTTLAQGAENPWSILMPTYQPGMRIGLKVNCLNMRLPTSRALVRAIIASLRTRMQVDSANIIVWDRRLDELMDAGQYSEEDLQGAKLLGTVRSYSDASGPGYTSGFCGAVEGATPRLSRILTHLTDITINCPVLKTHAVSGVTAGLKNIYGIIDNPGSYHDNLPRALPALYALPPIRKHIQLTIVDALRAVTLGGTESPPDSTPRRIFIGKDPVAVDRYALDLVNSLRAERSKVPVGGPVVEWLDRSYEIGLGAKTYTLRKV